MSRLNFREACLLDASGELGKTARRDFLDYIRENPAAADEYREICQAVEALENIPPTEFSAQQRIEVPANIKASLRRALQAQEHKKKAAARQKLIRYAWATVGSVAAAIAVVLTIAVAQQFAHRRSERDRMAKINTAIDHLLAFGEQSVNSYDQAVSDVEASIRQLQKESPTLAQVQDHSMTNLLNALVTVPEDWDDISLTDSAPPTGSI